MWARSAGQERRGRESENGFHGARPWYPPSERRTGSALATLWSLAWQRRGPTRNVQRGQARGGGEEILMHQKGLILGQTRAKMGEGRASGPPEACSLTSTIRTKSARSWDACRAVRHSVLTSALHSSPTLLALQAVDRPASRRPARQHIAHICPQLSQQQQHVRL